MCLGRRQRLAELPSLDRLVERLEEIISDELGRVLDSEGLYEVIDRDGLVGECKAKRSRRVERVLNNGTRTPHNKFSLRTSRPTITKRVKGEEGRVATYVKLHDSQHKLDRDLFIESNDGAVGLVPSRRERRQECLPRVGLGGEADGEEEDPERFVDSHAAKGESGDEAFHKLPILTGGEELAESCRNGSAGEIQHSLEKADGEERIRLTRLVELRGLVEEARHVVRLEVRSFREMLDGRGGIAGEHLDEGRNDGMLLLARVGDSFVVFDTRQLPVKRRIPGRWTRVASAWRETEPFKGRKGEEDEQLVQLNNGLDDELLLERRKVVQSEDRLGDDKDVGEKEEVSILDRLYKADQQTRTLDQLRRSGIDIEKMGTYVDVDDLQDRTMQ
jgi:hypothetical protein